MLWTISMIVLGLLVGALAMYIIVMYVIAELFRGLFNRR